jgi:hypothetical protein
MTHHQHRNDWEPVPQVRRLLEPTGRCSERVTCLRTSNRLPTHFCKPHRNSRGSIALIAKRKSTDSTRSWPAARAVVSHDGAGNEYGERWKDRSTTAMHQDQANADDVAGAASPVKTSQAS